MNETSETGRTIAELLKPGAAIQLQLVRSELQANQHYDCIYRDANTYGVLVSYEPRNPLPGAHLGRVYRFFPWPSVVCIYPIGG